MSEQYTYQELFDAIAAAVDTNCSISVKAFKEALPERCGCKERQPSPYFPSMYRGINIIANDSLPSQTMIVSRDVFEMLRNAKL